MAGITAEQAIFLNGICMDSVKRESVATKNVIAAVPADRTDYKPDECSKSAMELMRHIAAAECRLLSIPIHGEFNTSGPSPLPESAKTPAEIAAWYEQSTAATLAKLSKLTAEQLTKIVDFRGLMQMPAGKELAVAAHESPHHRRPLSAYLLPQGRTRPADYGE